ncbi:MAG: single-stranded DNA-binding protein [Candidatus Moranbacteria bacterium]|nr:single-stranded DNA-binding protein [Candidatus Moranbacteria bacterium]
MASLNKVQLIGHLGRDPEVRYLPNGDPVANITIATSSKYKNKAGELVEETEWHRVTFFGRLAEIAGEYLKKGRPVYIEGRIKTRKYTDKDGVEKYATDIIANEMQMLGDRGHGDGKDAQQQASQPPRPSAPRPAPERQSVGGFSDMDDDIPFADPMSSRAFCLST